MLMKRGQAEVRLLLLVFELILVLVISLYYYQILHQQALSPPKELDQQLTDLALQSGAAVTNLHLISSSRTLEETRGIS